MSSLRLLSLTALSLTAVASAFACNSLIGIQPPVPSTPDEGGQDAGTVDSESVDVATPPVVMPEAGRDEAESSVPPKSRVCPGSDPTRSGTVDPTFRNGVLHGVRGGRFESFAVVIDDSSRIYVVGGGYTCVSGTSGGDFAVARFLESGEIDTSYGGLGDGAACADFGRASEDPLAATLDAQGRLVVVGRSAASNSGSGTGEVAIARFTTSGLLDPDFAPMGAPGHGRLTLTPPQAPLGKFPYTAYGVTVDDDALVVSGSNCTQYGAGTAGFLFRLSGDGAIDASFTPTYDTAVTGYFGVAAASGTYAVAATVRDSGEIGARKFSRKGAPDIVFNARARAAVLTNKVSCARSIAFDSKGNAVVGGSSDSTDQSLAAVARFAPSGALDPVGFSQGPFLSRAIAWNPYYEFSGLTVQCDDKIVVGGAFGDGNDRAVEIERLEVAGGRDTSFGTSGIARSPTDARYGNGGGVALDPKTGKVVYAVRVENRPGLMMYRFFP